MDVLKRLGGSARPVGAFVGAYGLGFLAVLLFSVQFAPLTFPAVLGTGIVIGLAALLTGGLVGFLFGIPRTSAELQRPGTPAAQAPAIAATDASTLPTYQANTNLEQISDWLTKILVGVGLTQIGRIGPALSNLGNALAPGFGGTASSGPFALALVIYHVLLGFLGGFLWTRIYLAGAFRYADQLARRRAAIEEKVAQLPDPEDAGEGVGAPPAEQPLSPAEQRAVRDLDQRVRGLEASGGELNAKGYRRLARQLRRAGDYDKAVRAYLRAYELDPTDPAPLNFAGAIKSKYQGDYEGAQVLYRQALAANPTYVSPVYNLACNEARRGRTEQALALLAAAITADAKYERLAREDSSNDGPFHALRDNSMFTSLTRLRHADGGATAMPDPRTAQEALPALDGPEKVYEEEEEEEDEVLRLS